MKKSLINFSFIERSREGNHVIVEQYLKKYKDLDPSIENNKAFKLASANGHLETVKLLLGDSRVDPSDNDYNKAIIPSIINGHHEVVKFLLGIHKNITLSDDMIRFIECALSSRYPKVLNLLLKDGRISLDYNKILLKASINNNSDIVKVILECKKNDMSLLNSKALFYACVGNKTEAIKVLLDDKRSDPSKGDNCLLKYAFLFGHVDTVNLLLKDKRFKACDFEISHDKNYSKEKEKAFCNNETSKILLKVFFRVIL